MEITALNRSTTDRVFTSIVLFAGIYPERRSGRTNARNLGFSGSRFEQSKSRSEQQISVGT